MIYSPPGFLNIWEFLNKMASVTYKDAYLNNLKVKCFSSPTLCKLDEWLVWDCVNLENIRKQIKEHKYAKKIELKEVTCIGGKFLMRESKVVFVEGLVKAFQDDIFGCQGSTMSTKFTKKILQYLCPDDLEEFFNNTSLDLANIEPTPNNLFNSKSIQDVLLLFLDICDLRNRVRDNLSSGKLQAQMLDEHNKSYTAIDKTVWHNSQNWYFLLAHGMLKNDCVSNNKFIISNKEVYFKEEEVATFLKSSTAMANVSANNDIMTLDISKTRASEKLYLLARQDKQLRDKLNTTNKEGAKELLKAFAEKNAFFCLNNVQKEYGKIRTKDEKKIKLGENNSISTQDLQSCVSLLRPLSNQLSKSKEKQRHNSDINITAQK